jgi:hypothetical protein
MRNIALCNHIPTFHTVHVKSCLIIVSSLDRISRGSDRRDRQDGTDNTWSAWGQTPYTVRKDLQNFVVYNYGRWALVNIAIYSI